MDQKRLLELAGIPVNEAKLPSYTVTITVNEGVSLTDLNRELKKVQEESEIGLNVLGMTQTH